MNNTRNVKLRDKSLIQNCLRVIYQEQVGITSFVKG